MIEVSTYLMWLFIFMIVLAQAAKAKRDFRRAFSAPLIISTIIFMVFVKSYFDYSSTSIGKFLDPFYYLMTLAYIVVCLLSFNTAFERGVKKGQALESMRRLGDPSNTTVLLYVILLAITGVAGLFFFAQKSGGILDYYSSAHGAAGDWENTSAYLHSLPDFLWPALLISYFRARTPGRTRRIFLLLAIVLAFILLFNTILFGNRGGLIRATIIIGTVIVFVHRPSLYKAVPLALFFSLCIWLVQVLPHLRQATHLGAEQSVMEAFVDYFEVTDAGRTPYHGDELFFNVSVVQAATITQTHDFGKVYVHPVLNFVPRRLWKDKPSHTQFSVNPFILVGEALNRKASAGAAISAVAQSVLAFSWLGFLTWTIFGYLCGKSYGRIMTRVNVLTMGHLVASLLAVVYWGSQSFSATFNAWFFMIIPIFGLSFLSRGKRERHITN